MAALIILVLFIVGALLIIPIILASKTSSRLEQLSRQLFTFEKKLDDVISKNIVPDFTQEKQPDPIIKEAPKDPSNVPMEQQEVAINPPTLEMVVEEKQIVLEKVSEIVEPETFEAIIFPPKMPFTPSETWWEKFNKKNPDLEKFIGENLINKIGITVLVLGIAFFVKYAIDKAWINEYARVGIGVLAGCVVLLFAHRLQHQFKSFSSVLVAGAIAIFYFTITIGFQEYQIFTQPIAFTIMVGITTFSVFISLLYNRQELAVISLIGGFAAPFMVSTGEGNYKVLFSYILILDFGMLVLSFLRQWKMVHLLAFIFTIVLYGGWFFNTVNSQANPPYYGAFLFASLFYLLFFTTAIINSIQTKNPFTSFELSRILILNFLFCSVGLTIFSNYHVELKGSFIIGLSTFNFIAAWILYRKFNADKSLIYLLIGLTLTYATLAAPVQLNGNYITLFWAAESVLLLWLSQRSEFVIFRFASVIVNVLMMISLVMDWQQIYGENVSEKLSIVFNKGFITSIISLASFLSLIALLRRENSEFNYWGLTLNTTFYREALIFFAFITAYLTGILEFKYQLHAAELNAILINMIIACYHLVFSAIIIHYILSRKSETKNILAFVLALCNFFLFFIYINQLPFDQLKATIGNANSQTIGFLVHYISITAFCFSALQLLNFILNQDRFDDKAKKYSYWIIAFIVVYLCSSELLLHVLTFSHRYYSVNTDGVAELSLNSYYQLQTQTSKIGFPILWGSIAFVFIAIGMKKQIKELRILSLTLLALTLIKLFVYDIKNASEAGKIIAFILLGVLLLVMSFMYQKIKAIIMDDEK